MLETAVGDRPEKLWLQQKVSKSSRVNTNIASFLVGIASSNGQVTFLRSVAISGISRWLRSGGVVCLKFFVGIIDEIFLVRHGAFFVLR